MEAPLATNGAPSDGAAMGPPPPSTEPIRLAIIAALTRNNGLGAKGTLPWSLPKEMAHFRRATLAVGKGDDISDRASTSAVEQQESGRRNAVIMGRKTWESIPEKFRPLKDRINVVVSRAGGEEAERRLGIDEARGAHLVTSLDSAIALLSSLPIRSQLSRTFLIGGADLYRQALSRSPEGSILDRMLITRIYEPAYDECDVFLPEFRSPSQVGEELEQESGMGVLARPGEDGGPPPAPVMNDQATSPWVKASAKAFDAYLGTPVSRGVIEEKGNKYNLQMWTRRES